MARVKYNKGRTINIGNFESIRVDVGIELEMAASDGREIDATFDRLKAWVDKRIATEVARSSNA